MKNFVILIAFVLSLQVGYAEKVTVEEPSATDSLEISKKKALKLSLSTTVVSTHMWRGISAGTAPCLEPMMTLKKGGLSFSAWTCYAVDNSYREIDFFVTYKWKFIKLGLFDYYCPSSNSSLNDFTQFNKCNTQHLFEAQLSFYGSKKWPFKLTTACFIGGFDYDAEGDQLYSTYLELAYPFKLKEYELDIELGMTPARSMYAKEASLFNCGFSVSKDIKINDKWELPTKYKLIYNVEQKDLYFTISFTLS